jgi:hypothetical protein
MVDRQDATIRLASPADAYRGRLPPLAPSPLRVRPIAPLPRPPVAVQCTLRSLIPEYTPQEKVAIGLFLAEYQKKEHERTPDDDVTTRIMLSLRYRLAVQPPPWQQGLLRELHAGQYVQL